MRHVTFDIWLLHLRLAVFDRRVDFCSRVLLVSFFTWVLAFPYEFLKSLRVGLITQFFLRLLNIVYIVQMSELIRISRFLWHQPFIHLFSFTVTLVLLVLCKRHQLLSNFVLGLLHEFSFQTSLSILVSKPFLIVHFCFKSDLSRFSSLFLSKTCFTEVGAHFAFTVQTFKLIFFNMKSLLQNFSYRVV